LPDEEAKKAPKTGGKKAAAASAAAGASPAATSAKKTRLPMSGLLMFSNAKKAAVRRALAVGGADVTPEQVTAEVRRQWQELSAEQQQPYKAKADAVVAERAEVSVMVLLLLLLLAAIDCCASSTRVLTLCDC
jgi:HMG-box domain